MVIGKRARADKRAAEAPQVCEEPIGRGDTGDGKSRLTIDVGDSDRSTCVEERKVDADRADIHIIISGEHGIGGNQRVERLTQAATREGDWFRNVLASDEDDVDIAIELYVLKPVVQHVNGCLECAFRQGPRKIAICRDQY